MTGTVLWGVNNIYTVFSSNSQLQCRLKGKVLKDDVDSYNPLAPGDQVEFQRSADGAGMITARLARKNAFQRWNRKRNAPQTVAANLDALFCMASPDNPPFRPRFVDRAMVVASRSDIPFCLVVNKSDLGFDAGARARLDDYAAMGVPLICCSAKTGQGIETLKKAVVGKQCAFVGQSGVGKSSVLNCLDPQGMRKIGAVSRKYNRGAHTTVFAVMSRWADGTALVDTPGIREIEVFAILPQDLVFYYPDLMRFRDKCAFSSCLHQEEPDCAVRLAAEQGLLHPDRYESYRRLLDSLLNGRGD